jgi:hypothetical protein
MILLAGAALTVAALLLLLRARGAMDRRPLETAVAIVLPLPKAQAVAAVRRRLRDKEQPPNPAFKGFAVASAGEPVFPSDDLLRAAAGDNPPLQAYLAIPAAQREDDLYFFEPTGDRYWPSEYFKDGQPVRFRCAFLIHFEAASAGETRVDVLEYVPTVALGKRFGIGAHGPGFLEDIRPVAPTNFDRAQLLRWIAAAFSRK